MSGCFGCQWAGGKLGSLLHRGFIPPAPAFYGRWPQVLVLHILIPTSYFEEGAWFLHRLLPAGGAPLFLIIRQKPDSWLPLLAPLRFLCFWLRKSFLFVLFFHCSVYSEMGYWKCEVIACSWRRKERQISSKHKKKVSNLNLAQRHWLTCEYKP